MSNDLFQAPDYFNMDELLSEEHKLIRETAREWVKKDISPIIEEACQQATFPKQILGGLAEIGAFGPYIQKNSGAGLDQISYGLIMQELERGDSGPVQLHCTIFSLWSYLHMVMKINEKNTWGLPRARLLWATEPNHGSNPGE